MSPPANALVLCVDEKPQIQATDRTAPVLPMTPGVAERQTHDYERHGTTDLFAALDVHSGRVIGECRERHSAVDFCAFLDTIEGQVSAEFDVHLVLDNLGTHKAPPVKAWLLAHPRYHLHFTPTSSSWLNLVECWFSILTRKQLQRGVHPSVDSLRAAIMGFVSATNEHPRPFVWTKTADEILSSVARFCQRISNSLYLWGVRFPAPPYVGVVRGRLRSHKAPRARHEPTVSLLGIPAPPPGLAQKLRSLRGPLS